MLREFGKYVSTCDTDQDLPLPVFVASASWIWGKSGSGRRACFFSISLESPVKYWVNATGEFPVVSEDDMLRKTINEAQNQWWVAQAWANMPAQRRHLV
jgi:hypothetical protein